ERSGEARGRVCEGAPRRRVVPADAREGRLRRAHERRARPADRARAHRLPDEVPAGEVRRHARRRDRRDPRRAGETLRRLAAAFAMSLALPLSAAELARNAALDSELASIVNDPEMPLASLSVAAIRDGKVIYQRAFGHRWIDNADPAKSKPANTQTLYRV